MNTEVKNFPRGSKVEDLLYLIYTALKGGQSNTLVVSDITGLTGQQLDGLKCGDVVIKSDASGEHSYRVSFKGAGGLCLTYSDCENVETVAYGRDSSGWSYDDTTVTPIAS